MKPQLPFMSVVVLSYNGEAILGRALTSLLNQDYPKDRYEIIVVDDGSTDKTGEVAKKFPVRYIKHKRNQHIAAARNTGLAAAKGDIYVGFDDDGIAAPNWLTQLATGYDQPAAMGVGAVIEHQGQPHGLVAHYLAAAGSGNPPSLELDARQGLWRRFLAYVRDQLHLQKTPRPPHIIPVRHINGATASFPTSILKSVGGWDPALSGVEDTDLCHRLANAYPDRRFYAVTTATIMHSPNMSLGQLLKRPFRRGAATLAYYRRNHLIPPLFPFPLAWMLGSGLTLLIAPAAAPWVIVLSPYLLYFWWPVRAVHERQPVYFVLPFVQLGEELFTLAGLIRGYFIARRSRHDA